MAKKLRVPPMLNRVVSNIFAKSATTRYPFVKPRLPEDFRGRPLGKDVHYLETLAVIVANK